MSPHNQATVTTSIDPEQLPPGRDTFGAQTPVALVAIAAIAAIVLVNSWAQPAARASAAPIVDWSGCTSCGEIVHIREHAGEANGGAPFEIEVRMRNGALRTIDQQAPGLMVGDHVRLHDGSLTLQD